MLVIPFDPQTGWAVPEIKPYGPLSLDPASSCFHYCTNVFEGMKGHSKIMPLIVFNSYWSQAFLDAEGRLRMFRPDTNMARLLTSPFDPAALLACINKLVALESRWIPSLPGHSLYIRPTMIGTNSFVPSQQAVRYTVVAPLGPYFPTTGHGVSLLAVAEHVHSWPCGTGAF
ncbi:aminotransferase, partial [Mycena albidolilacea]